MAANELGVRIMQLHTDARELMLKHGLELGHIHEIPDSDGYRPAFGYIEATQGGGSRQRYLEIPVPTNEYARMDASSRYRILEQLERRLQKGVPTGAATPAAC